MSWRRLQYTPREEGILLLQHSIRFCSISVLWSSRCIDPILTPACFPLPSSILHPPSSKSRPIRIFIKSGRQEDLFYRETRVSPLHLPLFFSTSINVIKISWTETLNKNKIIEHWQAIGVIRDMRWIEKEYPMNCDVEDTHPFLLDDGKCGEWSTRTDQTIKLDDKLSIILEKPRWLKLDNRLFQ